MAYEPTHQELSMAQIIDTLVQEMLAGHLLSVGICAKDIDNEDTFFYIDKTFESKPTLRGPMNKLMGLYEGNKIFGKVINAPGANRSYRSH
jgi:hypothetical protein